MGANITAKVKCTNVDDRGDGEAQLSFSAHYQDDEGNRVNEDWARYTPALSLTMSVKAEVVESGGFAVGRGYTLTFTPDEATGDDEATRPAESDAAAPEAAEGDHGIPDGDHFV